MSAKQPSEVGSASQRCPTHCAIALFVPRRVRWDEQAIETYRRESVKLVAVTWNVGESKPASSSAFFRWLKETTFGCQVAMVALQEIEMGSSSGESSAKAARRSTWEW